MTQKEGPAFLPHRRIPRFWYSGRVVNATLFGLLFFLSGACGLVYELVWLRLITLVVGQATLAVTVVLTAYMGGLALGSWGYSRWRTGRRPPLAQYGWLEGGIALLALAFPWLLIGVERSWMAFIQHQADWSYGAKVLWRAVGVMPLMMLPTALMGATFPAAVDVWVGMGRSFRSTGGTLYALNVAGGVGGILWATFVGFPAWGVTPVLGIAVAVNVAVAGAAWWMGRLQRASPFQSEKTNLEAGRTLSDDQPAMIPLPGKLKTSLVVVGMAAMVGEVMWTRLYVLTLGSSTYAFAIVLVTYLLGLSLGGWWAVRRLQSTASLERLVASAALMAGASVLFTIPLFDRWPALFVTGYTWLPRTPGGVHVLQFALCVAGLLVPTMSMGMLFPLLNASAAREGGGREAGAVYTWNTLGNVAGPLAGLGLLAVLGSQATLWVMAAAYLWIGAWWGLPTVSAPIWRVGFGGGVAMAWTLTVAFQAPWDRYRLTSSPFLAVTRLAPGQTALPPEGRQADVVYYREGLGATVSVKQNGAYITMQINGKTDASTGMDMATQLLLGHLPVLLHPQPRQALMIGWGSGVTAGAMLQHALERVDAVELEPAVLEASDYFNHVSRHPRQDSRLRVWTDDGRNFLSMTDRRYDVISSEPSNPWMAGVANLFTKECYEQCADRLTEDGLMCQWLQAYGMREQDLQTALKTFHEVFPYVGVWFVGLTGIPNPPADLLVIGSKRPIHFERERLARGMARAAVQSHLALVGIRSVDQLERSLILNAAGVERYAGHAPLHVDGHPILEFSAPRNLYDPSIQLGTVIKRLLAFRPPPAVAKRGRVD